MEESAPLDLGKSAVSKGIGEPIRRSKWCDSRVTESLEIRAEWWILALHLR